MSKLIYHDQLIEKYVSWELQNIELPLPKKKNQLIVMKVWKVLKVMELDMMVETQSKESHRGE
jgi:hypothetical protein